MKGLLSLGVSMLAAFCLYPSQAGAATLADCLAQQHVCVSSDGRALISAGQEAQLEQQIGGDAIYLVVAPSGASGYNSAMEKIIGILNGHQRFTVGFLDSRLRHFGAYNRGMLPASGAAHIATTVVARHQADQNIFAALKEFVRDVQHGTGTGPGGGTGTSGATPSHALRTALIVLGVLLVLALLGFLAVVRPVRRRRRQEFQEAGSAAQEDLIALSTEVTNHDYDASVQNHPEAAEEQAAALSAYERGTGALDAARRVADLGAVSRAIAEGQYHLACARALAAGQPKPGRRPSCFFDPRHGMSVGDVHWAPAGGGTGRDVPACSACAHKLERGVEPEMRTVEANGERVSYINAGFAPTYWSGFGFGPGIFTGFLLGEMLAPHAGFPGGYDDGNFGGGDFGGGDFGGGDMGGGDFGGGDFS